jgi:hypothetical protein
MLHIGEVPDLILGPKIEVPDLILCPKIEVPDLLLGPKIEMPDLILGPKIEVPDLILGPKIENFFLFILCRKMVGLCLKINHHLSKFKICR